MATRIAGLHHVTAIASDPQRNLDFYTGVLGLRFVKRTVNFDDPGTYHFYFGDDTGTPGTILTFFPWPGASRGRSGAGEVAATAFSVPEGSISFWRSRLESKRVGFTEHTRFGATVLAFDDPDGMHLELIEQEESRADADVTEPTDDKRDDGRTDGLRGHERSRRSGQKDGASTEVFRRGTDEVGVRSAYL